MGKTFQRVWSTAVTLSATENVKVGLTTPKLFDCQEGQLRLRATYDSMS